MKRILLAGAGHAHLVLLKSLQHTPLHGARMGLISPSAREVYSGMIPGIVAGHYAPRQAEIDIAGLAQRAQVEFLQGSVTVLDAERRVAKLADGSEIDYDYASLDVGSLIDTRLAGAEHTLPVKPFRALVERLGPARRIALIGGVAGAELAMALRHAGAHATLYSANLSVPPALARRLERVMRRRRVDYRPGLAVTSIEPGPVVVAGTMRQEFDRVLLATGAMPPPWLKRSGLATDQRGFVLVKDTLQSVSHPEVFAAGDCATLSTGEHPKSGVYAVRHGEVLAQNLRNIMLGQPLVSYQPQPRSLSLISCGGRYALASWGSWIGEGRALWWLKHHIDKRWVNALAR